MKNHFAGLAKITLLALLLPIQSIACEWHNNPSLQNSLGELHMPSVGDNAANIARLYGEPNRKLNGFNGMDVWDYGSFRVMLKDNRVTFAGPW